MIYDIVFLRPLGLRLARLVLAGVDAAGESLYFFNPSLSQGSWVRANRTYHMTIGCHRFYK